MRRIIPALCLLVLLAIPTFSEVNYVAVSATTASYTLTTPGASTVTLKNDGAGTAYARVFDAMQAPAAATSANMEIKSGEALEMSRSRGVGAVSIVSASTSTVRVWWD